MKNTISKAGLFLGIAFTALILFAVLHNWQNEKHQVQFFAASQHEYYENAPASAQIQISPALAWDRVPGINKFLGFLFLAAMWFGIWYVATDRHLGRKRVTDPGKPNNALAGGLIFVPLCLSVVLFLASYSSIYSNNYVTVTKDRFDGWVQKEQVEKKGSKYVDRADSIATLFDKPFIR